MNNDTLFEIRRTNTFEKSLKKSVKKGLNINDLKNIVFKLANDIPLEERNKYLTLLKALHYFLIVIINQNKRTGWTSIHPVFY